jgi:hypothetical protein
MYDIPDSLNSDVTLAHRLKVRAVAEAKVKTDKIGASGNDVILRQ